MVTYTTILISDILIVCMYKYKTIPILCSLGQSEEITTIVQCTHDIRTIIIGGGGVVWYYVSIL